MKERWFNERTRLIWLFLGVLALFRMVYSALIPLTPQEAYYWYYSQHPAWGYFDHPPMAAYSIWLGTHLFGHSAFALKIMGMMWSLLTNLFLYIVIVRSGKWSLPGTNRSLHDLGVAALILYNISLYAHVYATSIMPDTPLIFFWLLTIYFVQEWFITEKNGYWLAAGAALGLAMFSKYTAVAILPGILFYLLIDYRYRKVLLTPWPYLGVILAFIVFSPVLIWNSHHDWASFLFQFGDRAKSATRFRPKFVGQLIASQLGVLTPLVFVWFIRLPFALVRHKIYKGAPLFFLLTGAFLIGGFSLVSFTSLVKMNWLLPGYISLTLAAVLVFPELDRFKSWLAKGGLVFSLGLIFFAHLMVAVPNFPLGEGNTWSGWPDAAPNIEAVQQAMGGTDSLFIFTNSYKYASQVKFYLKNWRQDVYAQNIYGRPALQFDYWPLPDSLKGKDALFVIADRREYKNDLKYVSTVFDTVTHYQDFVYTFNNKPIRKISLYYAKNYHGLIE